MKQIHFDNSVDRFDSWDRIATAARRIDPTGREWDDLMSVSMNQALDYALHLGMMEAMCDICVRMFIKEGKLTVQLQAFTDEMKTFITRDVPVQFFSIEKDKYFEYIGEYAECIDDEHTITVKFTKD